MDHDTKIPPVLLGSEIKRKSLPTPELKAKPSIIAFQSSDYDPTSPPAHVTPSHKETDTYDEILINPPLASPPYDSVSINQTLTSTPSFPLSKLVIPTKTDSLSSGFPFHQRLYEYRVTHDEWHLFTHEIVSAASLTMQEDWAAWTAGISTGVLSTGLLVFGGPVAGYYTGRSVHRKTVISKVKEGLMHQGCLRSTLRKWNEQTFRDKGFQAWLELPVVKGEVNGEDKTELKNKSRKEKNLRKKENRRFRILIIPNEAQMGMLMGGQQSSWSLRETKSIQQIGVTEEQPRIAELEPTQPGIAELA